MYEVDGVEELNSEPVNFFTNDDFVSRNWMSIFFSIILFFPW